ncbi:MAG: ABC transporter permease subunit [Desulfobacterales bacterium]|jgi:ABC-2 type transport system permease protein|nr:ABC transporter permease subunit [Desulfobacterales bacterium]MCK5485905.1 ABC transporter permease subunit [Desulfobacterales bacterium]NOQ18423.1 ABC transporter permease subunit [Desulfobacterales bacterium]
MRQVAHIFRKEFSAYFISPIAYIVISIFLLVTGWFFFATFFLFNQANLRTFYTLLPVVFAFVIPAITMRLISEELNIGSDEILLTMPVTYGDVILGKFLASVALIMAMLIPTLAYPLTVSFMGQLDWGPVVGGYVGAVFLGAAFSAVGLFASALTRNQIIAFIIGLAICFTLTLIDKMLFFLPQSLLGVFSYLGADVHFQNIAKGIIDSRDILYFISVCFVGLFGAHIALNQKY